MASLLIVEDEAPIASLLSDHLRRRGHEVSVASDGDEALACLGLLDAPAPGVPDLVVLDVMLPGRTGLEVCAALRRARLARQPVVLMLTAKRNEEDAIAGFEAGADDYVRKPFGVAELVRRIDALLALAARTPAAPPRHAGLHIDTRARTVHVGEREVHLTPKEHDLLVHLATHRGVVLDRERLLVDVWGYTHAGYARTVDSHVTRIRKKLEAAGLSEAPITTVHGVGYRYEEP
ncbi:MAG: response regulator transcription factor [Sandaracinaceae bacterium]|nr:response regulator transcription factor [Sandaracinaceae bacterium]